MFKRDGNHKEIKAVYVAAGCRVRDVAHLAGMGCDLIVARGDRGHSPVFIEIKIPGKKHRLTFSEETLQRMFPESYFIVKTPDEALASVGLSNVGRSREQD